MLGDVREVITIGEIFLVSWIRQRLEMEWD